MKAKLIVAFHDNTWEGKIVEVPDGIVPDKYYRGSVKWTKAVIKWATENVELEENGKKTEYLGMLNANPEGE
ncbi:hypothetical protein KAR91_06010 [Candidatus Pacearchaeota archaeon]|nr:hypothetical protein [Candidatus Pacearchaeota archaeon]